MAGDVFTVNIDTRALTQNIDVLPEKLDAFVATVFKYYAAQGESIAKKRAPWTDRTGNARNGLRGFAESKRDYHELTIAHGVNYGIWLEVRWAGRYAIIRPTIRTLEKSIMNRLQKSMGELGSAR